MLQKYVVVELGVSLSIICTACEHDLSVPMLTVAQYRK